MRRYRRADLPDEILQYLTAKQSEVDQGKDARSTWDYARGTKKIGRVVEALKSMTGARARCMYCEDSRGTDVDHFYPIVPYASMTFHWPNMLWNCTDCGRHKGNRFPLDDSGIPLLVDPTAEDPWDYLFYDAETGNLAARVDTVSRAALPKGRETIGVLVETLLCEAVVEGRLRTQRNLIKAVRAFSRAPQDPACLDDLMESVSDNDAYGLTRWFFLRDGREEQPFSMLGEEHPEVWARITEMLARADGAGRR